MYNILHSIQIEIDGSYREISNGSLKSINLNLKLDDNIVTYHHIASCICSKCRHEPKSNGICGCIMCFQPEKKSYYKHRVHELIYGKMLIFNDNGNTFTHYEMRNNKPSFWLKHWGFAFSPFRVAQSILRKFNMYLVDYTTSGIILDACVLFQLPYTCKSITFWHKHDLIPGVCKEDLDYKFDGKIRYCDLEDFNYSLYRFCSGLMHPN